MFDKKRALLTKRDERINAMNSFKIDDLIGSFVDESIGGPGILLIVVVRKNEKV